MYHLAVFPYERSLEKLLAWQEDMLYGKIIDIVSPIGWNYSNIYVKTPEGLIKVKTKIEDVSNKCNGLWVTESCRDVDFKTDVIPVLQVCIEQKWKIFWGRDCTEEEKKILDNMIPKNQILILGKDIPIEKNKGRFFDFKVPVVFWINMFPKLNTEFVLVMLYDAICRLGYQPKLVSYKKDMAMYKNVSAFPDFYSNKMDNHEKVLTLNYYLKLIERKECPDLFIVEIPGNLLEVSKKICGDFGCYPYMFSRALQPDFIIGNLPYMDTVLDNYTVLGDIVKQMIGIEIDCYNMIPSYLDVLESEGNEEFDYLRVSEVFVKEKVNGKKNLLYIFDAQDAEKMAKKIIEKLAGYNNVMRV